MRTSKASSPSSIAVCEIGEYLLVHDNGRSMGSHAGVKAVQSTSTSLEKLCDRFGKKLLVIQFEVVELRDRHPKVRDEAHAVRVASSNRPAANPAAPTT